jgi:hypothetical protein
MGVSAIKLGVKPEWRLLKAASCLASDRTAFNVVTEYTEITEKTKTIFRVFCVFRGYLHDIILSKRHLRDGLNRIKYPVDPPFLW